MKTQKSDFEEFVTLYEEWKQKACEALKFYHENIEAIDGFKFLQYVGFDGTHFRFEGDECWRYGGHEHYVFELDARILFDDGFIIAEQKRIGEKKAIIEQHLRERQATREAEERKTLEALKQKYETKPTQGGEAV